MIRSIKTPRTERKTLRKTLAKILVSSRRQKNRKTLVEDKKKTGITAVAPYILCLKKTLLK